MSYDVEGSLCGSTTRSNVSCLTFPSEPTADLTFIRRLLARQSTDACQTSNEAEQKEQSLGDAHEAPKCPGQPRQKWSIGNKQLFTPPVKLANSSGDKSPAITLNPKHITLNRSLFQPDESDNESLRHFGKTEDDDEDVASVFSVPSEIRLDMSAPQSLKKKHFGALMKKLSQSTPPPPPQSQQASFRLPLKKNPLNETYTKEDTSLLLSPCPMSGAAPVWSTVNNTLLDESATYAHFKEECHQEHEEEEKEHRGNIEKEDAENDTRILYEFIDEMFSKNNVIIEHLHEFMSPN